MATAQAGDGRFHFSASRFHDVTAYAWLFDDVDGENVISEQDGVVLYRYETLAMQKPMGRLLRRLYQSRNEKVVNLG